MMTKDASHKNGFTLIEVLVALGIFVIVITLAIGAYTFSGFALKRAENLTEIEQQGKIILEQFASDVRNCELDYSSVLSGGQTEVQNPVDAFTCVHAQTHELITYDASHSDELHRIIGQDKTTSSATRVHGDNLVISNAAFYVTPANDIERAQYPSKITLVIEISSSDIAKKNTQQKISLQTTITFRKYKP